MIIWENSGLVPIEAFTTFGINVKPNTDNPIGHFGTGLKYAVAVTLRLGGTFRLIRGDVEYEFYTRKEDFRGKNFDWVRMKKRRGPFARWQYHKLPFTTELGKDWQPWMVVRELESNCRDEGGYSIYVEDGTDNDSMIAGGPNTTSIIVQEPSIEEEHAAIENIFLPRGLELIEKVGDIEIYDKPSKYLWFRGLRVNEMVRESRFTYNFVDNVSLTEDRTLKYFYYDCLQIKNALMRAIDSRIPENLMDLPENSIWEHTLDFDSMSATPSPTFLAALGERKTAGRVMPKRFTSLYRSYYPEVDPDEKVSLSLRVSQWRQIVDALGTDNELAKLISREITDQEVPF